MPIDVFISYRGADRVLARKLERRLRSRWGSRVFRDETGLMPGQSWAEQLHDAVANARVVMALVGSGWQVRSEGEDWVRTELIGAIEKGIPVLPVLVGDPDELSKRLTTLPEAFTKQAVRVSEDLAGFDLHRIEKSLRDLGAFEDDRRQGLGEQRSDIVPAVGVEKALGALAAGRSVLVTGASGSGRSALLWRLVAAAETGSGLVASYGIDRNARARRTHAVVAGWVDGLCTAIHELPTRAERQRSGRALVRSVIDRGPDLVGRQVLRPSWLLALGDDESDRSILEAARRPIDRWAPFPPERLVSQSLGVLQQFAAEVDRPLTLIVDNCESIDPSSSDLVRLLLESPPDNLRPVLATSAISADGAVPGLESVPLDDFEVISLQDPEIWGRRGAIIEDWLERHNVRLGEGLADRFRDPNPYYALSALWYLVDNGILVEDPDDSDEKFVTWVPEGADEDLVIPSRDRLLDHMIEEFVPIRFRDIISAGALIGRAFPFSAAFAAAIPPGPEGEVVSERTIGEWRRKADKMWRRLEAVDPDGSVVVCHLSFDGERKVTLAQADLVAHFAQRLDASTTRRFHERLAQYFSDPLAEDVGESLDDRYGRAEAAADHWALAERPREAADAERIAAGLAEQALAYQEAREHYQRAIRLFTQLLAENARRETVSLVDQEDLLVLSNCLYRLGQMTRLASERGALKRGADPTAYFDHALHRLRELSRNLHDKRLTAPSLPDRSSESERERRRQRRRAQDLSSGVRRRDIPQPNIIRHHLRLCEALSGYINLELAEWHELEDNFSHSRELLFETLRHAEAARGEAGSRWLLAAASARLAQQLVNDAIRSIHREPVRSHNLAIEALFHIERVIGLEAVSPEEDRDLDDPRCRAWSVLGQILQHVALQPRLAEWAFRQMNQHRLDVSDVVDMRTDRQLGVFLLSLCGGTSEEDLRESESVTAEARELFERYARWATESGIAHAHSGAYMSLAMLALVEQNRHSSMDLTVAHEHVERAIEFASDDRQRRAAALLQGVLHAAGGANRGTLDSDRVLKAFRAAGLGLSATAGDEEVLRAGWHASVLRAVALCPHLKERARAVAERFFPDQLEDEGSAVVKALSRAETYIERMSADRRLIPSSDRAIWKLLECRVPSETHLHAERTRSAARRLLEVHRREFEGADGLTPGQLARDIDYAVAVHDWYRSTDPARLLTLAQESNASISGSEWASPNLLRGRLAIRLLDHQYRAREEIGRQRFARISSMVTNRAGASPDAGPLERVFFLASQMSEPGLGARAGAARPGERDWRRVALEPDRLDEAYTLAVAERERLVRQAGLPLVQDLHLLDATGPSIDEVLDGDGDESGRDSAGEDHPRGRDRRTGRGPNAAPSRRSSATG